MAFTVEVIKEGYSHLGADGHYMLADGTCTLVRGRGLSIIVDTLSPWDRDYLVKSLSEKGLSCDDIDLVVCTHGHPDHVGNLNLFQKATHIVGTCVSKENAYRLDAFEKGVPYNIAADARVIPTPGHTSTDVTLIVRTQEWGTVAVTGDLFEKAEDVDDPRLWREVGGSENPQLQAQNRQTILEMADHVIPGHGPMFQVTTAMRKKHLSQLHVEGLPPRTDRQL